VRPAQHRRRHHDGEKAAQSVLRRQAFVYDQQHPQLHGDIEDDRGQARQARERDLGNVDKRQDGEPQQRWKHPKIGVGFAVVRKRLEIDRFAVDGDLAAQQVNQHVVESFIQHLRREQLEGRRCSAETGNRPQPQQSARQNTNRTISSEDPRVPERRSRR